MRALAQMTRRRATPAPRQTAPARSICATSTLGSSQPDETTRRDGLGRTEGLYSRTEAWGAHERILKVDLADNVSTFIEDSNQTNAMGWDHQGRLISVQRARGNEKVGVLYPPEQVTALADNNQGQPFNSLNDLALDKRGGIYFTDTQGIYYLPAGGSVTKIIDEVPNPNGLVLSPDERTLYVHNKDGVYMLAFDVAPDGKISTAATEDKTPIPGHADRRWLRKTDRRHGVIARERARHQFGVEVFIRVGLLGVIPVQWGAKTSRIRLRKTSPWRAERRPSHGGRGFGFSTNAVAGPTAPTKWDRKQPGWCSPCGIRVLGR